MTRREPKQKRGKKGADEPTQVNPRRRAGSADSAGGGNRRELVALAALGLFVFLGYVLLSPEGAGTLGDAAYSGLRTALGLLAPLVPLTLLGAAVALILERRPRPGLPLGVGAAVLLVSILVLTAAGLPPFGTEHEASLFVREAYEGRAGWLGEVLYAGTEWAVGSFGTAVMGWLLLVAGVSLVSGVSLRRVFTRSRSVASAVKVGAEETTRRMKEGRPQNGEGPLDDPYLNGFGEVGAQGSEGSGESSEAATVLMSGQGASSTSDEISPGPRLLDGAEAFPDVYGPLEGSTGPALSEEPASDEGPSEPGPEEASHGVGAGEQDQGQPALFAREETAGTGAEGEEYVLPGADLLRKSSAGRGKDGPTEEEIAKVLLDALHQFGVDAELVGVVAGPRVTRYELQLAPGTKISKFTNLRDDLAYALASTEIRIIAPIPGKSAVGVEVPNRQAFFVTLGDIYKDFPSGAGPLMVWLGKDISGNAVYADLTKLPHLLIAGTTGSGKSGCINCLISSILLRAAPEDVRMILIDPKRVELSHYDRVPHLLVPVVTNMKNASGVLQNVVKEMDSRYELMQLDKARHLDEMNHARRKRGEEPLPYILVVIDELADLMMVAPTEVEEQIIRLAQKARAVGIHLVVATQRPSADVITGMIKANIPSRIAFAVSSQTDSRVIMDENGAEALLGLGDMLFKPLGSSRVQRVQGAYIGEEEIQLLVDRCRAQAKPEFREELLEVPEAAVASEDTSSEGEEFLADAAELVIGTGSASVSMLQRRLRVGYTRAGRLIDMLERRGIVGAYEGSKPREVLVGPEQKDRILEEIAGGAAAVPHEEEPANDVDSDPV